MLKTKEIFKNLDIFYLFLVQYGV